MITALDKVRDALVPVEGDELGEGDLHRAALGFAEGWGSVTGQLAGVAESQWLLDDEEARVEVRGGARG